MRTESVSDWTLERIALCELVGDELVAAHAQLAAETGGIKRLRTLEQSSAQILRDHPPEVVVPRILARIARVESQAAKGAFRRGWWSGLGVGFTVATAAVLCMVLLPPGEEGAEPRPEVTRIKGLQPQVVVHRAGDSGSERLRDGDHAAAGDLIQLGYVAGGDPFGAIISIDGAGAVTLHHPEIVTLPPVLSGDGTVNLSFSYELDDAPGFERFVFVTSIDPIDVSAVLAAARELARSEGARTGALGLPRGLHQDFFLLDKRVR